MLQGTLDWRYVIPGAADRVLHRTLQGAPSGGRQDADRQLPPGPRGTCLTGDTLHTARRTAEFSIQSCGELQRPDDRSGSRQSHPKRLDRRSLTGFVEGSSKCSEDHVLLALSESGSPRPAPRIAGLTWLPGSQISQTRGLWHQLRGYGNITVPFRAAWAQDGASGGHCPRAPRHAWPRTEPRSNRANAEQSANAISRYACEPRDLSDRHAAGRKPRCGGFARQEPGGLCCLFCGHAPLFRWILPRDHWLSGTDWRNRCRQRALDRALMNSGGVADAIFDMLEQLEGRSRVDAQEAPQPR